MKHKQIKLEMHGLDCANCASNIESKTALLDEVEEVRVDFVQQLMTLQVKEEANPQKIITTVTQIIHKFEPEVVVKERKDTLQSQTVILKGLDCASCATKIEERVRKLEGVRSAHLDFALSTLQYEGEKQNISLIEKEIIKIVQELEPDVVVSTSKKKEPIVVWDTKTKREVMTLAISTVLFSLALWAPVSSGVQLTLYVLSYLISGKSVLLSAARNMKSKELFDENFLMSIATLGAFAIQEYPEAVAVMLFFQIGELFQSLAVNRSRRSIAELMDIRPEFANLLDESGERQVDVDVVAVNDIIVVKPGERVPLDGVVLEGESLMDTSALTGESMLREVHVDSSVYGGFINHDGVLKMRVTSRFVDSTVAKILELVEHASAKKAPTEQFITKFAKIYTPIVVFAALALAILPPLLLGQSWSDWIYRALIFLVISCPCALVVSIPLGFFGGIGAASKRGILIKGGNYLEALRHVDTVVFDKTGTLTKGVFQVTDIIPVQDTSSIELLEYAAHIEQFSNHPIAKSICNAYKGNLDQTRTSDVKEVSGQGMSAKLDQKFILVGNARWMKTHHIDIESEEIMGSVVYVALENKLLGSIVIADQIKEDAKHLVRNLKQAGIKKTVMLTGDLQRIGEKIAQELQIDHVHTELLPDEKVSLLESYMKETETNKKVLYVGDGINDAPVLARADIGVAMGGLGSDAAIEAADIVLMSDEPSAIVTAISIAKKTSHIVWQNILLAFVVKGVVLLLGAGGLATMWEAVFADVGVTVLAVLNSIRVTKG